MGDDLLNDDLASYYAWSMREGPRFLKQFFKAGDVSNLAGAINITYGALVYDQVNREANAHAILKKEPWERSGFRVVTDDPSGAITGGADPGSVASVTDVSPSELDSIPAFMHTTFDVTADAAFRANHDDGLDIWEWKRAIMRDVHADGINQQLLIDAENQAANTDGNTTDAKNENDSGNLNGSQDTDPAGLETIDRMIASDAEEDDTGGSNTGWYDLYEGDIDRDSSTTYDSVVVHADGTLGTNNPDFTTDATFSMAPINQAFDSTEDNGADQTSQVMLTGRDTRRLIYDEFEGAGRYDVTTVNTKLDMGGLSTTATHPGRDISYTVRAYQDRPIVVDQNVPADGSDRIYGIDTRHHHLKVGWPTLYIDVDNPVVRGQFDTRAIYWTCEQYYCSRFNTSFKVRSIS